MATITKLVVILLLSLIAFSMLASEVSAAKSRSRTQTRSRYGFGSVPPSQCLNQCTRRCSATRYHKPCMFFCQKCCKTCQCVPPGTYGNKQLCPCYNNWKTQQGGPKCP